MLNKLFIFKVSDKKNIGITYHNVCEIYNPLKTYHIKYESKTLNLHFFYHIFFNLNYL